MLDAAIRAGIENWNQKHGDKRTKDPSTGLSKWVSIQSSSAILNNKTPKNIQKRWNEKLDPSVKRGEFTKDEGILFFYHYILC